MSGLSPRTYCGVPFGDGDVARRRPLPLLLLLCVMAWFATWTSLLAEIEGIGSCRHASDHYAADLSFSAALSLLPPTWLVVPVVTGFYSHGFRVTPRTCAEGGGA